MKLPPMSTHAFLAFMALMAAAFAAYYVYVKWPYEAERAAQDPRP
jgi:hypothetical protein